VALAGRDGGLDGGRMTGESMTDQITAGRSVSAEATWNWRHLLPILVAAVSAGFAWYAGSEYLRGAEARIASQYAEQHRTREVVVAARRLEAGTVVEATMLARRTVPVRYVPKSAVGPQRLADLLGRELAQPLDAGDVLLPGALRDSAAPALATQLAPGERALTIAVDDTNSHAGLLRPGDVVDLLFVSVDDARGAQSARIRPLLQAVRVLATGRALRRPAPRGTPDEGAVSDFATVTLQVSAPDAERIALAERAGELLVSLRAPGDRELTRHGPLALSSLLASGSGAAARRTAVAGWQVDGWIGGREGRLVPHRWHVTASTGGVTP
jgi:pilus assembly protein CpaB